MPIKKAHYCGLLEKLASRRGEVVAKMECKFEESKTKEQIKTNTSTD